MAHSRGASHQTARLKPESPFVEANVIVSHRPASLHLSLSGWYPAVPFSRNSFSVCLHLFSPFIPTCVSLSSPSSSSSVCPPHQLLLTTEHFLFLHIVSASTALQMFPSRPNSSGVPPSIFSSGATFFFFCQSSFGLS